MRPDRAWVRLTSGRRLNLIDPQPTDWTDIDLAVGLSRTYRWGGHSIWDLPLPVTQHSLLVLVLRQQMQPYQPLTPGEALRELLHDADEGLLGFDPISPLKPHLGAEFEALTSRLQKAIAARYGLPTWSAEDYLLHKRADHLAAASEALHVAGWTREEIHETLGIRLGPVMADPLPLLAGHRPWQPWPPGCAAALFLAKLRELTSGTHIDAPADLTAAVEREATIGALGAAFSRLPPATRRRCSVPVIGNSLTDTFVYVESEDISQQHLEGVIVDGERGDDGEWLLDEQFTVFTTEEALIRVSGWGCHVEVQ
ncbi:MAG: hypothetical protein ABI377_07085 [Devosia sp.]